MSIDVLCNPTEIDYNELEDYEADPLVICHKDFLSKVTGPIFEKPNETDEQDENKKLHFEIDEWYPFCNSYYPHSEEVDPFARVNHLLGLKSASSSTSSLKGVKEERSHRKFHYSIRQSQIDYLSSKPLSFLILGKPSIGEEDLGKQLAEYWNCVYLDPETLIRDEIESGSRAGQCIEFNLKCGRAIGIDVILRLVKKRVKTESVLHRGFVLCGLPVIPNDLYEEDPVSAESAIFTVQEIFEEIMDNFYYAIEAPIQNLLLSTPRFRSIEDTSGSVRASKVEFGEPEFNESVPVETLEKARSNLDATKEPVHAPISQEIPPDLGDVQIDICEPPEIGTNYKDQFELIMDQFDGPFMIVYMFCDNQDVIDRRDQYRYDIYSETVVDLLKEKTEKNLISLIGKKNQLGLAGISPIDEIFENLSGMTKDSSELIHLVKLPRDFPAHVQTQLQRFHDIAVKLIEAQILNHNPEYFLKVDGRTTISRIFNSVKWKLRAANVQRVILPEKLVSGEAMGVEGEDVDVPKNINFENMDKCFKDFCRRKIVNPMFKWEYSDWGPRCPVAMTEGNYQEGDPAHAVQFMNSIFYLSSQDAFIRFYRNPRPFLLPPNPRSHGKLYVIGPGCSGKTAVSTCLAHLLKCNVLSPAELYKNFVNQRRENLIDRMMQAMITDKLTILNRETLRKHELERLILEEKVHIWLSKFRDYIENEILKAKKSKSDVHLQLSSFPVLMGFKVNRDEIEREVPFEGIFLNENIAKELLEHPDKMRSYLPEELRKSVKDFVPVTVLEEDVLRDFEQIVRSSDIDEIVLGEEDLLEMYGAAIRQEENEYMLRNNCRGGWIIDGSTYDLNFFQRVYDECPPDHVIILEDSSGGSFLVDRYKKRGANIFTEYREFFRSIGRHEVAESIVDQDSDLVKERLVEDILGDILTQRQFLVEPGDPEDVAEEILLERRESQINYKNELQEFEKAKPLILGFLENLKKDVIVVDVQNKSLVDVMKEVISSFEDRYRLPAEVFDDFDRLEEARDFGYVADAEGAGEGVDVKGQEEFEANRRYGDTYDFCPVTFHDKWVLWRGKKEFMAKFQAKIYFCSNKEDLDAFLQNPRRYLPIDRPFDSFPPPRICVVGNAKSGKTSVAKTISKNFASCYLDFMEYLRSKGGEKETSKNYPSIQEYLQIDTPLSEELLQEFLYPLWFGEPYKTMGFIIDDFPKRPSDITFMIQHKTIPDIIIYLKVPKKVLGQRTIEKELEVWDVQVQAERSKRHEEHLEALSKWENIRKERFEQLMESKRQKRYAEKKQIDKDNKDEKDSQPSRPYMEDLKETDEEKSTIYSKSQVSFDSVAEQEDMDEVNKLLSEELPEPLFDVNIEELSDVTNRIKVEFDDRFSKETEYLRVIRELILAAPIPWEELASEKKLEVTQYAALLSVDRYNFRNRSFFERTYEISIEVAERLLACGFYFLSMFGRTCPIQYHNDDIRVQLFIPMEQQFNVFPFIHRQYIYFIIGKEARDMFRKDPLKYVDIDKFNFPLLPVRIAVIGPPKCGKSALADRFRTELGLKVISKGQAARYVKNYMPYSVLGNAMETRLRQGLELKEKMVLSCVEAATYDPRAITQGFLMDGFPNSAKEVKYLTSMGLMPQLVIDLFTEDPVVYDYVFNEALKMFAPPYSKHFLEYRCELWESDQEAFRSWLDKEYQNMARVAINTCMWDIWERAFDFVKAAVYENKHYFIHCRDGWPLRLANMLVTPLEYMERESSYKTYCPCCLYHFNKLESGGFPPDRTGLVHFRKHYYYVCPDHIEEFLETPCQFIPPYNPNKLPPDLPKKLELENVPDDVYQNGYCVVCCKEDMRSVKGNLKFATKFGNYVYLCDSSNCETKFMASPMAYFNVTITLKDDIKYPSLSYKDLPPLGALEQFVAKDVINAIKSTATLRPVLPGLTIQQSALVVMAMNLKINNELLQETERESYKKALELTKDRRKKMLQFLEIFRKYRNPFIYYEEPVPALRITDWIKERFGNRVPAWSYTEIHPDKAFDLLEQEKKELDE